jgi:NtrC-family two-component system response regulator AlgB
LVPLEAIEQAHLRLVTARTPTLEEAARVLGIDAATIYRKRKRWASEATSVPSPAP